MCRASMVERRACPDGSAWPLDVTASLHFRQREELPRFVLSLPSWKMRLTWYANVSWPSAVWSCTPFGGTEASATRCRAARAGTTLSSSQRSSTNARANSVDEQRGPRRQRGPRPCAGLVAMAATRTATRRPGERAGVRRMKVHRDRCWTHVQSLLVYCYALHGECGAARREAGIARARGGRVAFAPRSAAGGAGARRGF